jgi:hypothetical protein
MEQTNLIVDVTGGQWEEAQSWTINICNIIDAGHNRDEGTMAEE